MNDQESRSTGRSLWQRMDGYSRDPRAPALCLAVAMALAAAFLLWETRDQSFFSDEWSRYAIYPNSPFEYSLHGTSGHLIIGHILLYRVLFEVVGGDSYLPLRLVEACLSLTCAWLFFIYARERANPWLVAAAATLLLFLGSAWEVVATPYGIVALLPIACGLAALNCLRFRGVGWDMAACAFLIIGISSQGFALPFLAGAFVLLTIRNQGRVARSAWVFGIPLLLYAAWFVWSRTHAADQFIEDPVGLSNLAQVPATIVALSAVGLSAATGTFRQPSFIDFSLSAGYALLAVLALVAIARWQGPRDRPPPQVWVPLAMMLVYGALVGLALTGVRTPTNSRYVYLAALLVLLFLLELSAGRRLTVWASVTCAAVFIAGLTVNAITYRELGRAIARIGVENQAVMTSLDIAGPAALPAFGPGTVIGPSPEGITNALGFSNAQYQESRRRFGSPAFSPGSLPTDPLVAETVDRVLIASEGMVLEAAGGNDRSNASCTVLKGAPGSPALLIRNLRRGRSLGLHAVGPGAGVLVRARRFSPTYTQLGSIPGGSSATVTAAKDLSSRSWKILLTASQRTSVCLRGAR